MLDLFEDQPMTPEEIRAPIYWEDAECLKQVNLSESTHDYQRLLNRFSYCRAKWLYCKLAIWRDSEWVLFYSQSKNWPYDQNPFPGQLEAGYRASQSRQCHYFDLSDGRPADEIRQSA